MNSDVVTLLLLILLLLFLYCSANATKPNQPSLGFKRYYMFEDGADGLPNNPRRYSTMMTYEDRKKANAEAEAALLSQQATR